MRMCLRVWCMLMFMIFRTGAFLFQPADTRFAMGFGGGVDITVSKSVAIRAPKFDYIAVRTRPYWTHNFPVQSGIVFRFGS